MQATKVLSFSLAALLLTVGAAQADHRHGGWHHHGGFRSYHSHPGFSLYFGLPWYPRPYFSYPYFPYYPPEIVTAPVEPPVYIERDPPQTQQQMPSGYWYYCSNPEGYYPYVRECPEGWRQVDPIPQR